MRYLTFALAKGRLAKKTLALLEQIGITCDEMKDPDTRKLIFVNEELKLKFFLSKATDVPTYVEYGAADIGVVGKDTILEEGRNLYEVMDLGFGKCRMCVCGPHEAKKLLKKNEIIRVASKYPNIAKDYFNNQNRLIICNQANYAKSLKTGEENLEDIKILNKYYGESYFTDKMKDIIKVRKENKDIPYSEIAKILSDEGKYISKSGVAHIFKKMHLDALALKEKK